MMEGSIKTVQRADELGWMRVFPDLTHTLQRCLHA